MHTYIMFSFNSTDTAKRFANAGYVYSAIKKDGALKFYTDCPPEKLHIVLDNILCPNTTIKKIGESSTRTPGDIIKVIEERFGHLSPVVEVIPD